MLSMLSESFQRHLQEGFRTCLAEVQERFASGEICVDGAMGMEEGFAALIFFSNAKKNSYDDMEGLDHADHSYSGISDQEQRR